MHAISENFIIYQRIKIENEKETICSLLFLDGLVITMIENITPKFFPTSLSNIFNLLRGTKQNKLRISGFVHLLLLYF